MSEPRSNEDQPDHEWLEARERGEDISHVPANKREPYERLGAMIGSGMAPSPGFRRRVLDAIDAEEAKTTEAPGPMMTPEAMAEAEAAARKKAAEEMAESIAASVRERAEAELDRKRKEREQQQRRRRWIAVGALTAAAAGVAIRLQREPDVPDNGSDVALVIPSGNYEKIVLNTRVRLGKRTVRATRGSTQNEASLGDVLVVNADAVGPAELRIYGGDLKMRLYTRCNESEPGDCTITRQGDILLLSLELLLQERGKVEAVVCPGEKVPVSKGELNADLEATAKAGIECKRQTPTTVR